MLGIRLRDLYACKDTFVSQALTVGCNLTWVSERTGVAESTLRKHYGRFVHTSENAARELAKIDPESAGEAPSGHRVDTGRRRRGARTNVLPELKVEQKGFEPSTPTLRTWCSPN